MNTNFDNESGLPWESKLPEIVDYSIKAFYKAQREKKEAKKKIPQKKIEMLVLFEVETVEVKDRTTQISKWQQRKNQPKTIEDSCELEKIEAKKGKEK